MFENLKFLELTSILADVFGKEWFLGISYIKKG
jgi:hypothetical protein